MSDRPESSGAAAPVVTTGTAPSRLWGIDTAGMSPLVGERDRNHAVTAGDGTRYVLKLFHPATAPAHLDLQEDLLRVLAGTSGVGVPRIVPTRDGRSTVTIATTDGLAVRARLLTWVDGRPLADITPRRRGLLGRIGAAAGALTTAIVALDHPGAEDDFPWDLRHAVGTVGERIGAVAAGERRDLLRRMVDAAEAALAPIWEQLPTGLVHGDLNDHNVLVDHGNVGFIDFGDAHRSVAVAELAVAAAYAGLGMNDPVEAMADVATGFHARRPLSDGEIAAVAPLAVLRLAVSVVMAGTQGSADPDNAYLRVSEEAAWHALGRLAETPLRLGELRIRHACGLEPVRGSAALARWMASHPGELHDILEIPVSESTVCPIDWSVTSPDAVPPDAAPPVAEQVAAVEAAMARAGATVGVGRQGEPRLVYAGAAYAVPTNRGLGARSVHLGVDLSCAAGTEVRALGDGVVERIDDDAVPCGYGPVVTLRHEPTGGPVFYTLSGHLGRASVAHLAVGRRVGGGERIGAVGDPGENGGWVPHLHFQVMIDLLGLDGPFPGVALADQWPIWSSLCPSPRHALGLPAHLVDAPPPDDDVVAGHHRTLLPPSLSTSYATPLVAVRGHGPWLYDGWARAHLDAVNNVAHVGHQHPHVVAAQRRQSALTDTNSRYPHPERVRYLQRLVARFPESLDTVFLVNSGSEANELALRIARTATAATDVVVIEGGYHGNTGTLVDVSPYKHDGPGGTGPPPWAHTLPLPDPYRSPLGGDGAAHAAAARTAVAAIEPTAGIAAVLVESMPGVAGQIELPAGYLAALFAAVRARGGLCIADEVQVGLGRVGTHWWAFERQGVVPDIVTLGKPLGNGYPLGAVVTTRALADAFATGMEYFNTFGGNPVACAVGNAVLDVIDDEGLVERAATTGAHLRATLTELADRHDVVGDVRGAGLFLGVELVTDPETRTPATAEAGRIADRARELGVLLSVDGRFGNVLKIKPPLVFGDTHADLLVSTLDRVLGERPE